MHQNCSDALLKSLNKFPNGQKGNHILPIIPSTKPVELCVWQSLQTYRYLRSRLPSIEKVQHPQNWINKNLSAPRPNPIACWVKHHRNRKNWHCNTCISCALASSEIIRPIHTSCSHAKYRCEQQSQWDQYL